MGRHLTGADRHGLPPPPAPVAAVAAGRPTRLVWRNEAGGLTFEIRTEPERRFVKWAPADCPVDLSAEVVRLRWAAAYTPVPVVLDAGASEAGSWIVTAALPGTSAVADRWRADPARAVAALGRGLRALHDALPVGRCPFSWSAGDRVADAARRAGAGLLQPERWGTEHRALSVPGALAALTDTPPVDRLVVCHGDACAPNTLLAEDGTWSAHVDLGALGIADRWADLAVATWSTQWNYGEGWEDALLAARRRAGRGADGVLPAAVGPWPVRPPFPSQDRGTARRATSSCPPTASDCSVGRRWRGQ